jgi:hypothetical protein
VLQSIGSATMHKRAGDSGFPQKVRICPVWSG